MIRPFALRRGLLLAFVLTGCTDEITGPRSASIPWPRFTTVTAVPDKIAFMRTGTFQAQWDIWVMNLDGTGQTNLTDLPSNESEPSWSPDGTKIVFQSDRATGYGGVNEIYIMNADGTAWRQLTNSAFGTQNSYPTWSPVGNKIAFIRAGADQVQQVWVMNTDGTNQIQLTNDAYGVMQPSWSPDGSKIVFVVMSSTGPYAYEIWVMNADGTAQTRLTNNSNYEADLAWSPDGSKIAFTSNNGFKTEILTMNPDGTGPASLSGDLPSAEAPGWSPDGTRMAFVGGGREIYVMNADGTGATNVGNTPAGQTSYAPDWGTDPDTDDDGIYDLVDTDPTTFSFNFSDVPLGGKTAGTIVSVPANTAVIIDDAASPGGVRVRVTATGAVPSNARVHITLTGKQAQHKLAVPGTYVITDPVNSTIVAVEAGGPAEIELTLNGNPIVVSIGEGAGATVNETTNESGVLTDVTVSDVTGNSGDVTVNDAPVEPGSPPVAPSVLDAKLTVNRGKLTLTGTFTPAGTAAIDPGASDVTIEAGTYSFVKTGGLTRNKSGVYAFAGTLSSAPGVEFALELKPPKTSRTWTLKATANPVTGFVNPVTVSVQIGNVAGGAQVTATLR